jgi:hypothetical protein
VLVALLLEHFGDQFSTSQLSNLSIFADFTTTDFNKLLAGFPFRRSSKPLLAHLIQFRSLIAFVVPYVELHFPQNTSPHCLQ